jgi:class 3 adenylate cyclase
MTADQQTVGEWLEQQGLEKYVTLFAEQEIDWEVLATLTDHDLTQLGLPLGRRRKLLRAIANLSLAAPAMVVEATPSGAPERRHVTLLFADLVGSTELSTQLDPEDLGQLMLSFQRGANAAITRSGGHVARYLGDGLLAYFGWPTAAEDDAERAVRAGLEVVHATRLIVAEPHKLQVRVGIETGLVVIGALTGHGGTEELSVVGEAANLAARLQTVAEPNNVVIGPGTRQRLGGIFELSPQGSIQLKGFAAPVPTWQVLGESRAAIRFMAIHRDALNGLIGRQAELAMLSEAWQAAQQGRGQAILLSGEGGIGKSRIAAAFAEGLEGTAHNRLFYQCSAVHSVSVLHPVLRELEHAAGFDPADPPQTRFTKLERLFDWSGTVQPGSLDLVADWMGSASQAADRTNELNPQLRKIRAFALLLERIARLARERPLLVLLEDAHWSDPTTLELFRELLSGIAEMPVLVVITSRPEGVATWRALPAVTVQYVTRLAPDEIAAMIDRIAGNTRLPPRIVSAVQEKTDGMPLFVEELTKAILESEKAGRAESGTSQGFSLSPGLVPATLQDSLMGRLDRLGWAKELAQTGAVLGTEFSHELLSRVSDLAPARVEQGLERLVEAELLVRRGSGSSTGYIFRHALVQDTAYASLLRSRRRVLHGRVATILREAFPHAVESQPEVVARHLSEAHLFSEAIPWWRKAGQRSVRASSNPEAIEHFSRCLQLLEQLPAGPDRDRQELEIRVELGVPLMGAAGYMAPEFTANFTRALELSREGNDAAKLLFPALWAQWTATYSGGDIVSSEIMSLNFLKGAEQQGSRAMMVIGHRIHGITKLALGDLAGARRELEQSLSLYRDADDNDLTYVYGQNQRVAALSYLCLALQQLGYLDQAILIGEQAIAGASELGHFNTQGYALAQVLRLHMLRRDRTAMHRTGHALAALSEQHGAASWSLVARIAIAIADASASSEIAPLTAIRAGIRELQARRWNYWVPWLLLEEARVLLARHDSASVKQLLDETQHLIEAYGHRFCEPDLHAVRAHLLEEQGEPPQAVADEYSRAIDTALMQDAILPALRAATRLASLSDRPVEARAQAFTQLAQIVGRFTEGLQNADLQAAKELLDSARHRGARS